MTNNPTNPSSKWQRFVSLLSYNSCGSTPMQPFPYSGTQTDGEQLDITLQAALAEAKYNLTGAIKCQISNWHISSQPHFISWDWSHAATNKGAYEIQCGHLNFCWAAESTTTTDIKHWVSSVTSTPDLSLSSLQATPCMPSCLLSGATSISKTLSLNSQTKKVFLFFVFCLVWFGFEIRKHFIDLVEQRYSSSSSIADTPLTLPCPFRQVCEGDPLMAKRLSESLQGHPGLLLVWPEALVVGAGFQRCFVPPCHLG